MGCYLETLIFYHRTLDGRLNNPINIFNGAVGENLRRLSKSRFADGVYVPAGACSKEQRKSNTCPFPKENNGTGSNRPSPRLISNTLLRQVCTCFLSLKHIDHIDREKATFPLIDYTLASL